MSRPTISTRVRDRLPIRRVALLGIAVILAGTLAACTSAPRSPSAAVAAPTPVPSSAGWVLNVADVDGPPIEIQIGGHVVAEVSCSGYSQLQEGVGGVPPLPWSLDVRRQGGALLRHFEVYGGEDFVLLVRGLDVMLGGFRSNGPTTAPDACERWVASPVGSATASATPAPSGTCITPGWYRTNGAVRWFGDCGGILFDPPDRLTIRVGQQVEVHMTVIAPVGSQPPQPTYPLPTSTDAAVLRLVAVTDGNSTGTYQAMRAGTTVLMSSGWCWHIRTMQETSGTCPALAVTVSGG